jgi:hypothetical protein
MAEHIEKKISFTDKADAKRFAVLRFGRNTLRAPAPEIGDTIKIRFVECVNCCVHAGMKLLQKSGRRSESPLREFT